jgi:hypothetical protein
MHCRLHVFAVTLRGVLVVTVSDRRNDAAVDMACALETLAMIKCSYVWEVAWQISRRISQGVITLLAFVRLIPCAIAQRTGEPRSMIGQQIMSSACRGSHLL